MQRMESNEAQYSEELRCRKGVVESRRGRWVIKLAIALFLSKKAVSNVGELSYLHSEMWRHETLAKESRARGYTHPESDTFVAEAIWKRKLGRTWLKNGFDACMQELEVYLEMEFIRNYRQTEQQKKKKKGEKEEELETEGNATSDTNSCAGAANDVIGFGAADGATNKSLIDAPVGDRGIQEMERLYQRALRYTRRVEFTEGEWDQGWIFATELLEHLRSCNGDRLSVHGPNKANNGGKSSWLPTTPKKLVALLRRLDLLGRLQFRWEGVDATNDTETKGEEGSVFWVRAAWAHSNPVVDARVLSSHPVLSLQHTLSLFSPTEVFYDAVENVSNWKRDQATHGGRVISSFRPFLLLVPGGVLLLHDNNIERSAWSTAALRASKITCRSAFIRISQAFLQLHLDRCVRVVQALPGNPTEAFSPSVPGTTTAAMRMRMMLLLPLSEMDPSVLVGSASPKADMSSIRTACLYGDGVSSDAIVETVQLMPEVENQELNTTVGSSFADDDAPLLRGLTRGFLQLLEMGPATEENMVAPKSKTLDVCGATPFNTTVACSILRFVARASACDSGGLGVTPLGTICKDWLEDDLVALGRRRRDGINILPISSTGKFAAASLILPLMQSDGISIFHGRTLALRRLRSDIKADVFSPVYVSAERSKVHLTVYFEKGSSSDGECNETFLCTPMLLLRPLRADRSDTESNDVAQKESDNHRAVFVFSRGSEEKDDSGREGGREYVCDMAVEMNMEEEQRLVSQRHDDDKKLQSFVSVVDEWVLEVAPSISEFIEHEFVSTVRQDLSARQSCFASLPVERQSALIESLRQQFLVAVTPVENEMLEYLGDAVLEFVLAQKKLDDWTQGPIVKTASNQNISCHLPDPLLRHLQRFSQISNNKRRADVVEALFGAVAMALWVIPRRTGDDAAAGLLPFTCVLQAVHTMIRVLRISLD